MPDQIITDTAPSQRTAGNQAKDQPQEQTGGRVTRILVVDYQGNGWNVYSTIDGKTWLQATRRSVMNQFEKDQYLSNLLQKNPAAEVREVSDFYGRIPEDWMMDGTRLV